MRKEEFLAKLRKNLSVLEEKEIQDIVEEYAQHIDMKMKEGLSEEAAIQDFGDLKELTAGILEAYHVKSDYTGEKSLDMDKVKEEGRKATQKAATAISKGAGAIGRGAGAAGRWGKRQAGKLLQWVKKPFDRIKERLEVERQNAGKKGLLGRIWLMALGFCKIICKAFKWCVLACWNLFWLFNAIFMVCNTLLCIFLFGMTAVLLSQGYPLLGVLLAVIGCGMVFAALTLLCGALMTWGKTAKADIKEKDKQLPPEDQGKRQEEFEYPEEGAAVQKIVINEYQEVLNHA